MYYPGPIFFSNFPFFKIKPIFPSLITLEPGQQHKILQQVPQYDKQASTTF